MVTSLGKSEWRAQDLYEQLYCARGEMEKRIPEQLRLSSGRLSTEHSPQPLPAVRNHGIASFLPNATKNPALRLPKHDSLHRW